MRILYVLLMFFCLVSCGDDTKEPKNDLYCEACGVIAPQNNLKWLVEKISDDKATDKPQIASIWVFKHDGNEFFLFQSWSSSTIPPHEIYDCSGNAMAVTEKIRSEYYNERDKWVCIYTAF
ncbi:hypothetical protein [Parabacteroides sp.]|uniref:hypothetical protein n=1 Tax=Parabacteroides sp. TaxID=1869337 RepID=UPI0026DFFF89|nr:hypothetical protein [Parabacteroides sp.]MDO5430209.1 hypothetical protein [Parabacteroides sp.]